MHTSKKDSDISIFELHVCGGGFQGKTEPLCKVHKTNCKSFSLVTNILCDLLTYTSKSPDTTL